MKQSGQTAPSARPVAAPKPPAPQAQAKGDALIALLKGVFSFFAQFVFHTYIITI